MKMMHVLVLRDGRVQNAQRLAHQAGLQAHVRIADLAFDLGPRHQGRHRVDDDDVHGVGFDEHLGDLERLFAVGRLADEQPLQIDAQALGPARIEGVFGVDERRHAALPLGVGDGVQGDGRLAARFRAEDFDDPAARQPAAAQGDVEARGPGGDARHIRQPTASPKLHDRAFAELLFDLRPGRFSIPGRMRRLP